MTESVRLNKYLADRFSCSRREADNYVEGGWVRVDGRVVEEPGFRIEPHQKVEFDKNARAEDHKPVTILLHKPVGYGTAPTDLSLLNLITPENQAPDDRSDRHLLKRDLNGLHGAMLLEAAASGLVILTQDRTIARKLEVDGARMEQEYVVEVAGDLHEGGLQRLNHGLAWQGQPLPPIKVSWQSETRLRFALKNPPVGVIQDMCRQVGLEAVSVKRIRIGRVPMSGLLPGQWRYRLDYERF